MLNIFNIHYPKIVTILIQYFQHVKYKIAMNSGEIAQPKRKSELDPANRSMSNPIQIFSLKNSKKKYVHTKEARRLIFQSSNRGSRTELDGKSDCIDW